MVQGGPGAGQAAPRARPRVFATRRLPGRALERLGRRVELHVWPESRPPTPAELIEAAREAEGLLCLLCDRVDRALFDACPRLRVISSVSVGVDHIDLGEAARRCIPVGHTPGVLTETTAELAFALLLAAARRVVEADRFVRGRRWTPDRAWDPELLLGRDLLGATLGILGAGAIGAAVARRAAAFGMRVAVWSRSRRELPGVAEAEWGDLEATLRRADFLSIHLPLTDETRGLLDARRLALLPRGAILVNTARGPIVDEPALVRALESGQLAAAGLDVFAEEPLPAVSPLLRLENVVLTPHIGSASLATRARMADLAVENLLAGLEGRPMPHCANEVS